MEEIKCEDCKWWVSVEKTVSIGGFPFCVGECCIRSVPNDSFPKRYEDKWCGEYIKRDPEAVVNIKPTLYPQAIDSMANLIPFAGTTMKGKAKAK